MRISLLSFGALTAKSKGLVKTKWNNKGTPSMPLELCRVAKSGKLVLAISQDHGVQNNVYSAISVHPDLNKAISDFMSRENIGENQIGVVDLKNKVASARANLHSSISRDIAKWAKANKIDAVIYNGLNLLFKDRISVKFSVENAVGYVQKMDAKLKKSQIEYLKTIPNTISTPVLSLLMEQAKAKKPAAKKVATKSKVAKAKK